MLLLIYSSLQGCLHYGGQRLLPSKQGHCWARSINREEPNFNNSRPFPESEWRNFVPQSRFIFRSRGHLYSVRGLCPVLGRGRVAYCGIARARLTRRAERTLHLDEPSSKASLLRVARVVRVDAHQRQPRLALALLHGAGDGQCRHRFAELQQNNNSDNSAITMGL